MSWPVRFVHGDAAKGSRTKLYGVWGTMLSRCRNPNFKSYEHYGARGIRVCKEWEDFIIFRAWALAKGYQEGLEIDRREVDGDYCPENCRWRPRLNNLNKTNSRIVVAFDESKELAEWVRDPRCIIPYHALKKRLNRGWPPEEAITEPPKAVTDSRRVS